MTNRDDEAREHTGMTHPPERRVSHPQRLDEGHPFRQWKTWRIPGTGLTLTGYSRANDKTFFHVPELRCSLDAGLAEGRQVETVLLTHTHLDHSKDLDYLAARDAGVDIYLPADAAPYAEAYLRASSELNHGAGFDPSLAPEYRLHGVRPGAEFSVGRRGEYAVRVVECLHKVPCVGYCFAEKKTVLKPEYEELKASMVAAGRAREFGRIIAERRREGAGTVDQEIRRPAFAFLGDTHASVFALNPWLFDHPVIITECTYLDDERLPRARQVGHTVWSELRPVVEAHPENLFVLTHFSLRHSDREIIEFFQHELESGAVKHLDNVVLWVHPESRLTEQHQSHG
ncbi:MBL fold metallo-hydrolase [Streptomyces sp. NBC_01314]|uniref:MBL fold metallo-hydrolase n=1 Tax=Streptomyces sp. NBC_01314 TaxID=2903821 RepID=UPI003085CDD8|nr:MBL fold metallo-hydrolase [Streptomyces sp. NBC_01314]